jgi:DNA-binding CsgD family transcriptional regulator
VILTFKIRPPWWASIAVRVVYSALLILVVLLFIRYVDLREKRKTQAFQREQLQRVEEQQAEFRKEVEKSESELIALRNEKLRADINHKTSQLASATMHLVQKSEILMKLRGDLEQLAKVAPENIRQQIVGLRRTIEDDIQLDNNWDQFELYFDQVHENFFKRLRQQYPQLTPKDQKLCAYLRMNLSTKEIAPLLNISVRGVEISRYRVRKKFGLDGDTNLVEFIMDV